MVAHDIGLKSEFRSVVGWKVQRMTMSRQNMKVTIAFLCVLMVLAIPMHSMAALGGDVDSVEADRAQLRGTARIAQMTTHSVHEIRTEKGVMLKEYVSPAGQVFAVSWKGPANPDLRQVMGNYYDQFQRAVRARTQVRGPISIHEPGLVVQMSGTMRAHFGRAYVPQMVPAQLSAESIR